MAVAAAIAISHQAFNNEALVLDAYTAAGGTNVLAAYSVTHRLSSSYSGPLYRVRRAFPSNAELDIGFTAANVTDTAALGTHCAGADCFLVTLYDQSGGARNATQATAANQPKLWDASAGIMKVGNLPVAYASSITSLVGRANALGLTGSPAVSIFHAGRSPLAEKYLMLVGGSATSLGLHVEATTGNIVVAGTSSPTAVRREFTASPAVTEFNYFLATHAAAANFNAITMRQNGADLVEAEVAASTMSIADNLGRFFGGAAALGTEISTQIVFGAVVTGAPRTPIEAFGAECRTLAGY